MHAVGEFEVGREAVVGVPDVSVDGDCTDVLEAAIRKSELGPHRADRRFESEHEQ